ncbi:MAG: competence CoiA-like predicted nuclease [Colwellia sp.]|jgi:competence CoiA-like predicted nuclease
MSRYRMDSIFIPDKDIIVSTEKYLDKPVDQLFDIRRKLRPIVNELSLLCPTCYQPLILAGRKDQTFYFRHVKDSEDCPIKTTSHLTKEEIEAMKYNGQKEGRRHKENKLLIASILESDPFFNDIRVEKTFREENPTGIAKRWRRPDVSATHAESNAKVAFELQVSTTFIDVIIDREHFYRDNGAFIIWVFLDFEENKFTELDIFYANKSNAFVLDEEAIAESQQQGELVLKCFYREYCVEEAFETVDVKESTTIELVRVSQLSFDQETGKLYFFDSTAQKIESETKANLRRKVIEEEKERKKAEEKARREAEARVKRRSPFETNSWKPNYFEPRTRENKGISDSNFNALSKTKQFDKLKCDKCGNTENFYDRACFIYCEKCRSEVKY